jgi:hypothetical protein
MLDTDSSYLIVQMTSDGLDILLIQLSLSMMERSNLAIKTMNHLNQPIYLTNGVFFVKL